MLIHQIAYSFCMAMLHSLWQASFFLIVYLWLIKSKFLLLPLSKRNFLFYILAIQCILFVGMFFIYFYNFHLNYSTSFFNFYTIPKNNYLYPIFFYSYIFILFYQCIKTGIAWYYFKKNVFRNLQKPNINLILFTYQKVAHLGIKRKVFIWLSPSINTPITIGFLKPIIILPFALFNQISMQQAESLILHELSHIKANDYVLNLFLLFVKNVFFFNPCIHIICKNILLEREKNCDRAVISFQYNVVEYAQTLLFASAFKIKYNPFTLAAIGVNNQLLKRVQYFSSPLQFSYKQNKIHSIILLPILFLLVMLMSIDSKKSLILNTHENTPNAVVTTYLSNLSQNNIVVNKPKKISKNKKISIGNTHNLLIKNNRLNKVDKIPTLNMPVYHANYSNEELDKQIIVTEETSGTNEKTLEVYDLKNINGNWKLIPNLQIIKKDTCEETRKEK